MTDQERLELMLEYAAGTLDSGDAERARLALLSGDPAWAAARAEAEATMSAFASAIEPIRPPTSAKSDLMTRIARQQDADRQHREEAVDPYQNARKIAKIFTALAAMVLLAVLVNTWTKRQLSSSYEQATKDYREQLQSKDLQIVILEQTIQRDQTIRQVLHNPSLKVVDLGGDSKAVGRLLIEQDKGTWHVFATALAPLPAEKEYELWFITPEQKKIRAGMFNVDIHGNGQLTVPVPPDIGPVALAAITDEPKGGLDQPTGSIHLVGKLQ